MRRQVSIRRKRFWTSLKPLASSLTVGMILVVGAAFAQDEMKSALVASARASEDYDRGWVFRPAPHSSWTTL